MKKLLLPLAFVATALAFTACNSNPNTTEKPPKTEKPVAAEVKDAESCTAAGGNWLRGGLGGFYSCVYNAKDAGKSCTDSSQCEYRCLAAGEVKAGKKATGECEQTSSPFGCNTEIKNGIADGTLCID